MNTDGGLLETARSQKGRRPSKRRMKGAASPDRLGGTRTLEQALAACGLRLG